MSQLSACQSQLKHLSSAASRLDDVATLVELGQEENDADTLHEAQTEIESIQKDLDQMEIETLMDGEYDSRSAVVTIRSGAGGVDAADFAQMLLRMYLRWAERNGYKAKVMDTSYAEEAGIKSATFQIDAPYAYGRMSVEGGTHRLVRISPFDNQGVARPASLPSKWCRSSRPPITSKCPTARFAWTPTALRALAARA